MILCQGQVNSVCVRGGKIRLPIGKVAGECKAMFITFSDVLWRALLLIVISVAPWAAPLETATPSTHVAAVARLLLSLVGLGALTLAGKWAWSRWRACGVLVWLAIAASIVASIGYWGARGPLARGVWIEGPLVWIALASLAYRPLLDRYKPSASGAARGLSGAALLALGAANLLSAHARLADPAVLSAALLNRDPGNENAAIARADGLRAAGQLDAASRVLGDCATARKGSCRCADRAACIALQSGSSQRALQLLDGAGAACGWNGSRLGMRAEALMGLARMDEAMRDADSALALNGREPHASYARSRVLQVRGDPQQSLIWARRAVDQCHGSVGRIQLGMLLLQSHDLDQAAEQFDAVLKIDADHAQAIYGRGLVAQGRDRYRDAREDFLRTLQLDPSLSDARYSLALLTYSAGARDEARHHLDKLAAMSPTDPRLPALRSMLSAIGAGAPTASAPNPPAGGK